VAANNKNTAREPDEMFTEDAGGVGGEGLMPGGILVWNGKDA
jgi:hypothetical protein